MRFLHPVFSGVFSGVATTALAVGRKIVCPIYGTKNHSVGDMYSTETVVPTHAALLMTLLLKSPTGNGELIFKKFVLPLPSAWTVE